MPMLPVLKQRSRQAMRTIQPLVVEETLSHCNGLLGTSFTMEQVVETLKWLDFNPEVNGDEITCHIPSYRIDIEGKGRY
jgi:phenylalanyl-tRNA synthetase beta chain